MEHAIVRSRIFAFAGPNIFGPRPGVLLRARCDRDRSARVRAALKDAAQFVGLVIAYLSVDARHDGDGVLLSARFSTEMPALGAELAAYVLTGVAAEAARNDAWDRDGPLLALQARRRREALPLPALQLIAEARRRGLHAFVADTHELRIGYGARGWGVPLATLGEGAGSPPTPPWERLGHIPVIAVTGASGRADLVRGMAAHLSADGSRAVTLDGAGFETTRAALADPGTEALVVGLDTAAILRRGVAFERCTLAAIADRDGDRPVEAADDEEWLRALGVPMLLAEQPARVNLADSRLLPLVAHAPHGVIGL